MGYINTRNPNSEKNNRIKRLALADKRRNLKEPVEYKKIQEINEQKHLKALEKFEFIDGPTGVRFDKDPKVFYSDEELKEALDEEKAINDTDYGLTDEELKAKARQSEIYYLFE